MKKTGTKKYVIVIWLMMLATLMMFASESSESKLPPSFVKILFATSLWGVVLLFPYKYVHHNDLGRFANRNIVLVLLLTLIAVVRTAIAPFEGPVGNKWVTMFGNQDTMFMLLTPCFVFLSQGQLSLSVLKIASCIYMSLGIIPLAIGNFYPIYSILWFTGLYYPYMKRGYKMVFYLSLVVAFINAIMFEETDRSVLLLFMILMVAYVGVYIQKSKKLLWIICLGMMILPLVYAIMTMCIPEFSAVQIALETVMNETGNETLATDTRTFLFRELADDLTNSNSWILGKGAVSHYYSDYFARSATGNGDYWVRISVEVTLLQFLLRSGVIYVITYFSLIFYAVVKVLRKAQNKFLQCVAVVASGWVLYACITYLNGCNFIHLGFFLLLGCCMSKRWLSYTDEDIEKILKQ